MRTCILGAGASSVIVVPEPLAAAVGSGIDIGCKYAKFLVDFGEGVTDCAIIRNGQIVASLALDHFGLVGFPRRPITSTRVLGAVVLLVGVALVLRPSPASDASKSDAVANL